MLQLTVLLMGYLMGPKFSHRAPPPSMQEGRAFLSPKVRKAYEILQASRAEGMGFEQNVADLLAGEYDRDTAAGYVTELANSAPVVIFSYAPELSPGCNKAIKSLRDVGVEPTVVRLDQPWSEGNMIRSALGRMTGSASIPSVWIGGDYIGGCDEGPSEASPGLVPMAFRGTLRQKLEAAGARVDGAAVQKVTIAAADAYLSEQCDEGLDVACEALEDAEEEAKRLWLAKLESGWSSSGAGVGPSVPADTPLYAAPDVYRGTQAPSDMRSAMPRPKTPSEEASEEFFKKTWSSFMKQLAAQRREYFYDDFESALKVPPAAGIIFAVILSLNLLLFLLGSL